LEAVDFFCGAGGMTCGLRQTGINVIGGIDIEKEFQETYERNNPNSTFLPASVTDLMEVDLEAKFNLQRNNDGLIFIGCSPCQFWTNMNTTKDKSVATKDLLGEFQRFVEYFKPGYVILENVPGFQDGKSPLAKFKKFLQANEYNFDEGVLNAKFFGIPQNRRRFILIASRFGDRNIALPVGNMEELVTVRDAIGHYPYVRAGNSDSTDFQHEAAKLASINLKRIQATPHDGGSRRAWSNNEKLQVPCYRGKNNQYTDYYGRMYWDRPSPAITTKFIRTSNGRYGHPEQDRAISLREGATLQSFPEDYIFYSDSIGTKAQMIGNAVPPRLAQAIGQQLLNHYNNQ